MAQHCKALQTSSRKGTAQTLPRAPRAARPAPPAPRGVRGCKLGTWPKPSSQQEAGEGGMGLRLALGKVNQQIQLIQHVRGRKDPGFICYPEPRSLTPALLGALRLCRRESQLETRISFWSVLVSKKHGPPMAALSASLFRGIAVPAAMGWDVTTPKSWQYWRDPEYPLIAVSGGTQWCIGSLSL